MMMPPPPPPRANWKVLPHDGWRRSSEALSFWNCFTFMILICFTFGEFLCLCCVFSYVLASFGISPVFSFVVVLGVLFDSFEVVFCHGLSYDDLSLAP